ncbi:MAG: hypothetical protein DGJ47_000783 [Rickettsiaceae bacterium]
MKCSVFLLSLRKGLHNNISLKEGAKYVLLNPTNHDLLPNQQKNFFNSENKIKSNDSNHIEEDMQKYIGYVASYQDNEEHTSEIAGDNNNY